MPWYYDVLILWYYDMIASWDHVIVEYYYNITITILQYSYFGVLRCSSPAIDVFGDEAHTPESVGIPSGILTRPTRGARRLHLVSLCLVARPRREQALRQTLILYRPTPSGWVLVPLRGRALSFMHAFKSPIHPYSGSRALLFQFIGGASAYGV